MHEVDLSRMRAQSNVLFAFLLIGCDIRELAQRLGLSHPSDDWYPEDWVASVVLSRTKVHPTEGINMVSDGENEWVLRDLIEAFPDEMLGVEHVRRFGATRLLSSSLTPVPVAYPGPSYVASEGTAQF